MVNCSRTLLRRRKAYTVPLSDDLPAAPPVDDTPLYEALASLNEGLRLPVAMYYLEGMSVREVAQALRLPQGTVKNRLMRARKKLAAILKEEE